MRRRGLAQSRDETSQASRPPRIPNHSSRGGLIVPWESAVLRKCCRVDDVSRTETSKFEASGALTHLQFVRVHFGYTFGYRRQLGTVTLDFVNFYRSRNLDRSEITVHFAYLSMIYVVLRRLKIRRRQLHGGSTPPPGTSIISILFTASYNSHPLQNSCRFSASSEPFQVQIWIQQISYLFCVPCLDRRFFRDPSARPD